MHPRASPSSIFAIAGEWLDPQALTLSSRWSFSYWWQCRHRVPLSYSTSFMCRTHKDNTTRWALHHVFYHLDTVQWLSRSLGSQLHPIQGTCLLHPFLNREECATGRNPKSVERAHGACAFNSVGQLCSTCFLSLIIV